MNEYGMQRTILALLLIWKIIIGLRTRRKKQMNKEWSELNKLMQNQIKKKDTYEEGISTLFELQGFHFLQIQTQE